MFTVAVKIEGVEKRRRSAGAVHALIGFFLLLRCYSLYQLAGENVTLAMGIFAAIGAVSVAYAFLRRRHDATGKHNAGLRLVQSGSFFSFGFLMFRAGQTVEYIALFAWALLCLILFFSERKIFLDTVLRFTDEGVRVPGSYREHLVRWDVLESVAVRHDFITLNHRGRKYLQYQVMQDLSELEVVKMNAFCREKIEITSNLSTGKQA